MLDIDDMFFAYCILLKRSASEFWESRPSQIEFCIDTYTKMVENEVPSGGSGGVRTITSMREIAGWGDKV